ncbi:hypothetical protein [Streptomyces sp. V4I2]|uniref:hypothetical protein n=1 Tax=Streptomyces sp. V4I2 TaxID=3042280 RepID=UPI0027D78A10|nr:hypothetical protein [Streptomyces sp. V4I2]
MPAAVLRLQQVERHLLVPVAAGQRHRLAAVDEHDPGRPRGEQLDAVVGHPL